MKLLRAAGIATVAFWSVVLPAGAGGAADSDITLIAGGGEAGHGGDGGPAVEAQLIFPEDCEFGPGDVIYVAEDARIRRIGADGIISTFAGGGPIGALGEGGPATDADVWPAALAVDAAGTVYVADFNPSHPRILTITPDGTLTRIAGTGTGPGYSGDGGPAIEAQIGQPLALALTNEAVYFTDEQGAVVRRVDLATGTITVVPELAGRNEITAGPDGTLYAASFEDGSIVALGSGGQLRPVGRTGLPIALAVDSTGTVYVSDGAGHVIHRITADGTTATIAEGSVSFSRGLGIGPAGELCIADTGANVVLSIHAPTTITPPVDVIPPTGDSPTALWAGASLVAIGAILVVIARPEAARERPTTTRR